MKGPRPLPCFEQVGEIVPFLTVMLGLSHAAENPLGSPESVGAERKQLTEPKPLSLRLRSILTGTGPLVHGQMPTSPAGG